MPYLYKCYSCMKSFRSNVRFDGVRDGGACPRCNTLITRVNLIGLDQGRRHRDFGEEMRAYRDLVRAWQQRMHDADAFVERLQPRVMPRKSHVGTPAVEGTLNTLEQTMCDAVLGELGRTGNQRLVQALGNRVVSAQTKQEHDNRRPLLVFRFYTGTPQGLYSSSQGGPGQGAPEQPWVPERVRGRSFKSARDHQRGKKSGQGQSHRSDVVSTTCSLRNLVRCTAGRYHCTPGGQVVPIIFGNNHMPEVLQQIYAAHWAPYVCLILLPAQSYVIDWTDYLVDNTSESTSADVSFFEREVSYDTWGGQHVLSNEKILCVCPNPFRGMLQTATGSALPFGNSKKPSFGGPKFGGPKFGGPKFGGSFGKFDD